MLKIVTDVKEYMDFVNEINGDPDFGDPMLQTQEQLRCNLLESPNKPAHRVWGVFEEKEIIGLFVFLVLEEESYLEMLVGLSRVSKAYEEMLSFLKKEYRGCQVDFVFNPGNRLLYALLQNENAVFYAEQQKMVLKKALPYEGKLQAALYDPGYREQYSSMHQEEGYWTADRVIEASDKFRIILAIADCAAIGYIDVTCGHAGNELYDIFVKEEYRQKGYGRAMLAKAIELNGPGAMTALVDADNAAAIALLESAGFVKAAGENSRTASLRQGAQIS